MSSLDTERAKVAVERFQRMAPLLSSFASSLSGGRVVVVPAATTSTDGKTIYVRVPIELAENLEHDRKVCDQRDEETYAQLCLACDQRERVMAGIFHEISHVAYNSFAEPDIRALPDGKASDEIRYILTKTRINKDVQAVASRIHQGAPAALAFMEDVRVDHAMQRARPGLRDVQRAMLRRVLRDPDLDWPNMDPNAQAVIAPLILSQDEDMLEVLDPYLVECLESANIVSLVRDLEGAKNPIIALVAASTYISLMQDYGFFQEEDEDEENDEDSDGTEANAGGASSGGGGDGEDAPEGSGSGAGSPSAESSTESSSSGSESSPESGGGSPNADGRSQGEELSPGEGAGSPDLPSREGGPGDSSKDRGASRPEDFGNPSGAKALKVLEVLTGHEEDLKVSNEDSGALEKVIESVKFFDAPSVELRGVKLDARRSGRHSVTPVPEGILGPATLKMRRFFEENRRAAYERNRKSGRVSSRVLGRRAWSDDPRLFQAKRLPGKRDYAVLIGVDISGSTSEWRKETGTILQLELQAAFAQAELCQRLGLKFAVYCHSGTTYKELYIKEVKSFSGPWDLDAKSTLLGTRSKIQNYDGHTMEFYRKRLDEVSATQKVLMYYSDGAMPAENYDEELDLLKREIETCRKRGYVLLSVGVDTDDPIKHGLDTVRLDRIEDIRAVVDHLGSRLLKL